MIKFYIEFLHSPSSNVEAEIHQTIQQISIRRRTWYPDGPPISYWWIYYIFMSSYSSTGTIISSRILQTIQQLIITNNVYIHEPMLEMRCPITPPGGVLWSF